MKTRALPWQLRPRQWSWPGALAFAVVAVTVAAFLQYLAMVEASILTFVTFFPAVAVTAYVAGWPAGLAAVILSASLGNLFFVPPALAWSATPAALIATVFFVGAATMVMLLCASFREAFFTLERARAALDASEERYRQIAARLEKEDRNKDRFLAALSHELRNFLAPARQGLEMLDRADSSSARTRRHHQIVARQLDLLGRLVDDLLDISRVRQARVEIRTRRLDLAALLLGVVEERQGAFDAAGIRLETRIGKGPVPARIDAARIVQAIGNLLTNAEKYTPRGGLVTVSLEREERMARVSVRDTGVGVSAEMTGRIFAPFVQADGANERRREGLGLGLALAKALVDLHGGTIGVQSEGPGQGAEFIVRLPIDEGPLEEALPAAPPEPARAGHLDILVIEDNAEGAEILKDALESMGHRVRTAPDGPLGIAAARASRPDAVICDIGLPGMDGYEVARAFRADPALRDAYLVAFSGYAGEEDRRRAEDAGFDAHLAKPATCDQLDDILRNAHPVGEGAGAAG